jgi:protein-tyrosine phosphatase/membrane-associated phospholipid phosphatase
LCLLFLAPFFFLTYGTANELTTSRSDVASVVFTWERHIPFLDWTILPYWSIDLLYGLSLFVCVSRDQLLTHVKRLISAQVIAVCCFLLFPLTFSFERPVTDSWPGQLFTLLSAFDKPFNQAPSLHIALLVILWVLYAQYVSGAWRWLLHGWFALIGVSVLTTYQHHFFDVPTGMLVGWLCVWAWPENQASPLAGMRLTSDPRRRALALRYGMGAALAAMLALLLGGIALWLFWLTASLLLVACSYLLFGPTGLQKQPDGRLTPAAAWLLAPYLLGAWVNSRWWTRRHEDAHEIAPGVWLGRIPAPQDEIWGRVRTVIDLSAELPLHHPQGTEVAIVTFPTLDLTVPTRDILQQVSTAIEAARAKGPVLVCCALGYSRSAVAIAAWLLRHGGATDAAHASEIIRQARPAVALSEAHMQMLASEAGYG